MTIFGKIVDNMTIFGKIVDNMTIFGKTVNNMTIFGKIVENMTIFDYIYCVAVACSGDTHCTVYECLYRNESNDPFIQAIAILGIE